MSINTVTTSNALGTADTADGFYVGKTATSLVGFYGATPVVQQTGGTAAVTTTAVTSTSPFGYTTSTQAQAIVTLVNELRAALVTYGLLAS